MCETDPLSGDLSVLERLVYVYVSENYYWL